MSWRGKTDILYFGVRCYNLTYETLLYSPELKFYSNRVKMDARFNTSIKGLHCLGDSSGWTRGLMMASVMGVLMGREIAAEQ